MCLECLSNPSCETQLFVLCSCFHKAEGYSLPCLPKRMHSSKLSLKLNGILWTNSFSFFSSPNAQLKSLIEIQQRDRTQVPWQMWRLSSLTSQYKARGIHVGCFPWIPPGANGCCCNDEYSVSSGTRVSFKNSVKFFPIWLWSTNSTNSLMATMCVDPLHIEILCGGGDFMLFDLNKRWFFNSQATFVLDSSFLGIGTL